MKSSTVISTVKHAKVVYINSSGFTVKLELNPLKQLDQKTSNSSSVCTVTPIVTRSKAKEVIDSFLKGEYMNVKASIKMKPSPTSYE